MTAPVGIFLGFKYRWAISSYRGHFEKCPQQELGFQAFKTAKEIAVL